MLFLFFALYSHLLFPKFYVPFPNYYLYLRYDYPFLLHGLPVISFVSIA